MSQLGSIASSYSNLQSSSLNLEINTATVAKVLQTQKIEGESLLRLIDSAKAPNNLQASVDTIRGHHIDTYA